MKPIFFLMLSLGLAACSHNPPKPYGKFFPINGQETIYATPNSLMKMNNQPLDESK